MRLLQNRWTGRLLMMMRWFRFDHLEPMALSAWPPGGAEVLDLGDFWQYFSPERIMRFSRDLHVNDRGKCWFRLLFKSGWSEIKYGRYGGYLLFTLSSSSLELQDELAWYVVCRCLVLRQFRFVRFVPFQCPYFWHRTCSTDLVNSFSGQFTVGFGLNLVWRLI